MVRKDLLGQVWRSSLSQDFQYLSILGTPGPFTWSLLDMLGRALAWEFCLVAKKGQEQV